MNTVATKPAPTTRPAAAPAQPWKWLVRPVRRQGLLQIGQTLYLVTDVELDHENGMCGRIWQLKKADGSEYQITLDRSGELACDCPDATYRQRQCKHVPAVVEAYSELDRAADLERFLETPADYRNKSHDAEEMPF
jgi:hypothetical protein